MKTTLFLLFSLIALQASAQLQQMPITEVRAAELPGDAVLVDVRTPEEFAGGHLPGAVNIDWFAEDFNERWADIPKDARIYVYCQKGGRSARAAGRLTELGFTRVTDLTGGYDAYRKGD